jgi:hypothetical protein
VEGCLRVKRLFLTGIAALFLATGTAHNVRPAHSADALDRIYAEQFNRTRAIGRCETELMKYQLMLDLAFTLNVDFHEISRNHKAASFFDSCMKGEGYRYNYKGGFKYQNNDYNCGKLREKNYGVPETLETCWEKLP